MSRNTKILNRMVAPHARRMAKCLAALLPARMMRHKMLFSIWQERGYHVTPVHFYEPVPDTRTLPDSLWAAPSSLIGVNMREPAQLELLERLVRAYKPEYERFPLHEPSEGASVCISNGMFVSVDAEMLYCLVRDLKPHRIIEVGSGFSTLFSSLALDENKRIDPQYECELSVIDPYPNVKQLARCRSVSRVIRRPVQEVAISEFLALGEGDILFIDSSHVSKVGSDVNFLLLDVIPRLRPGVYVHLHDIHIPSEYPKQWIKELNIFWNEQYLLQAFLMFNSDFEVVWAGSYLNCKYSSALAAAFPSYEPASTMPGSFWIRRVAGQDARE